MAFFSNADSGCPFLYLAQQLPGDTGWCGYVLPKDYRAGSEIDIGASFNDLPGSYLFSFADISLAGEALVERVWRYLQNLSPNRAILWIDQTHPSADLDFISLGFSPLDQMRGGLASKIFNVTNALTGPVSGTLRIQVPNNCEMSFEGDPAAIRIIGDTASAGPITFNTIDGIASAEISPNRLELFFSGPSRGCLVFDLYIREGTDFDIFDFGLKYFIPDKRGGVIVQRYPLLRPYEPMQNSRPGFRTWIDLTNIQNRTGALRTFFAFTGKNKDASQTVLPSAYATVFGHAVNLIPQAQLGQRSQLPGDGSALMVFQSDPREGYNRYLSPSGEFEISLANAAPQEPLMCGLNGTESISFTAGDLLRFGAGKSAFAPIFPFPLASPVGPPIDPAAPLMTSQLTTSWANVVKGKSSLANPAYMAQPKGSSLYGRDNLISAKFPVLFGHRDPAYLLPGDAPFCFPLVPYSAVQIKNDGTTFTREQIENFELQVLGATRRGLIGDAKPAIVSSAINFPLRADVPGGAENIVTPSGVVATLDPSAETSAWTRILLGQIEAVALQHFSFEMPDRELIQAFQTSQLFLVVANSRHLGKLASSQQATPSARPTSQGSFENRIEIGGWGLAAQVGQNNQYGEYRDVLIFKGRRGKIYDPPPPARGKARTDDSISLVANPLKWTQRQDFSSPTVQTEADRKQIAPPDESQQIILSQWLRDYFEDVRERAADPQQRQYFQKLDEIARDENWTGFLVLKMTIEKIPNDLAGIAAGIEDPSAFNAHHFGIEIGQVLNEPGKPIALRKSSSMFGLVHYVDQNFIPPVDGRPPQPIAPASEVDYDFRLLMLSVLFENTAVRSFQSYAQITLNRLFGAQVDHMGVGGNPFNTIVLSGGYQQNNGAPVYSLSNTANSTFYFKNNVIQKLQVASATMSTRNPGNQDADPTVVSWIAFTGFIDFKILQSSQGAVQASRRAVKNFSEAFDIFSFGNDEGQDLLRKGLSFSNLGLRMSFPVKDPAQRHIDFSAGEMSFDIATSTPRAGSLYSGFSLQIRGLQHGAPDTPPSRAGYAAVITDAKLTGVDGGEWWGICYQLNMGTPGNLAGGLGLTSNLLTGWGAAPGGENDYKAMVGLQLPGATGGAKLISLQNVLRLSIGQMRLTLDRSSPKPIKPFLLMMTDIALKFLGLLKIPPGGSSLFYLFGNPEAEGKPSGLGWYAMYKQDKKAQ
jgi:hypothetical protein